MLEIKERRDLFDDVVAVLRRIYRDDACECDSEGALRIWKETARDEAKTALDMLTQQFVIFVGAVSGGEPFDVTAAMVPWPGGEEPPADYGGGKVLRRNGRVDYAGSGPYIWKHDPRWADQYDIIAYTPKGSEAQS